MFQRFFCLERGHPVGEFLAFPLAARMAAFSGKHSVQQYCIEVYRLSDRLPRKTFTLMSWKTKTAGGIMTFIGFMLSPLSWWNDLFVNIPIAWVFAWFASIFYKPAFYPALF